MATTVNSYARQAIRGLRKTAKNSRGRGPEHDIRLMYIQLAKWIRVARHFALPAKGEIYRSAGPSASMPTLSEVKSFYTGLPDGLSCLEYEWPGRAEDEPKRLTLVANSRVLDSQHPLAAGFGGKDALLLISVFYSAPQRQWQFMPVSMSVPQPLNTQSGSGGGRWSFQCAPFNLLTGHLGAEEDRLHLADLQSDFLIVTQFIHEVSCGFGLRIEKHGDFEYMVMDALPPGATPARPSAGLDA